MLGRFQSLLPIQVSNITMDKSLKLIQKLCAKVFGVNLFDSTKVQLEPLKLVFHGIIYISFIISLLSTLAFQSNTKFLDKIFLFCGLYGICNGLFLFYDFFLKKNKYLQLVKWTNDRIIQRSSKIEDKEEFDKFSKILSKILS